MIDCNKCQFRNKNGRCKATPASSFTDIKGSVTRYTECYIRNKHGKCKDYAPINNQPLILTAFCIVIFLVFNLEPWKIQSKKKPETSLSTLKEEKIEKPVDLGGYLPNIKDSIEYLATLEIINQGLAVDMRDKTLRENLVAILGELTETDKYE